jgi:hypothetical protein
MRNVLRWGQEAHDNLCENKIRRCFVKATVLPLGSAADTNNDIWRLSTARADEYEGAASLIAMLASVQLHESLADSLGIAGNIFQCSSDLIDFDMDAPTGSSQIDMTEIMESVLSVSADTRTDSDDDEIFEPVSIENAIAAVATVRKYVSFYTPWYSYSSAFVRNNDVD